MGETAQHDVREQVLGLTSTPEDETSSLVGRFTIFHIGRGAQLSFLKGSKNVTVRQWLCTPCFASDTGYAPHKGVFQSLDTHPDMEAFSSSAWNRPRSLDRSIACCQTKAWVSRCTECCAKNDVAWDCPCGVLPNEETCVLPRRRRERGAAPDVVDTPCRLAACLWWLRDAVYQRYDHEVYWFEVVHLVFKGCGRSRSLRSRSRRGGGRGRS